MIRALADRGHQITFFDPDAYDRQKNRDMADPSWARVHVYPAERDAVERSLELARTADFVVKCSGVGVFDEELEKGVLELKHPGNIVLFWDVDAPATLDRMERNPKDPFRELVPRYDLVFTYGGGSPVVRKYTGFGARRCVPIYNALDRSTHFRVKPEPKYEALLGFLGNRLPDREKRVEDFFLHATSRMPSEKFVMGGSGWADKGLSQNINYLGHVYTHEHNALNSSLRAVLNLSRESMASYGFSPATRVFEAAGAGACIITDAWEGIELFLEPGREILVAKSGDELIEHLRALSPEKAREIGEAAFSRVCSEHTYEHRAKQVSSLLGD
jgi:spore maturation protein CgeB